MTSENYLLLIYGYFPNSFNQDGFYKLMNIVDERGAVDKYSLATALKKSIGKELTEMEEIFFNNLEELNKFSYKLMDDLEAPLICVLSIDNYNTCLEKCSSLEEFKSLILESANCLENIDYTKNKGILSKIFN